MADTGMEPTVARFHALARSSPWRWQTLRFTWASFDEPSGRHPRATTTPVRAHVRRPGHLRVEDLDGQVRTATIESSDGDRGYLRRQTWFGRILDRVPDPADSLEIRESRDGEQAVFDDDGLVTQRPWEQAEADDPMWDNYTFVAALDPVEFANPRGGPMGVRVDDLHAVDHHGRPAWEAVVTPTDHYTPRCDCCSLLLYPGSFDDDPPPAGLEFPDAHRVRLDVRTGVCVTAEQVGGSRAGAGHELVIEAVDDLMPDDLFTA